MRHTDNAPLVRAAQLTALLHDIFYAAEKMGLAGNSNSTAPPTTSGDPRPHAAPTFSIEGAVETLSNLLWNVFDRDRNRPLSVLQLKQTFLLLCQPPTAHQDRLIYEHFLLSSDHNGCVSRMRLESMVVIMSQLFGYLDPAAATELFSVEHIGELLHECFALCPGPVGLTKFQFYAVWQRRSGRMDSPSDNAPPGFEPYASVYAAVGRMAEACDVLHLGVSCAACRRTPVRGLLFRCRQCRRLALCFECFATDAKVTASSIGHGHDSGHRMDEISSSTIAAGPSRWRAFVHKMCAMFTLCPRRALNRTTGGADEADNITMETHVLEMGGIGCRGVKPEAIDVETAAGDLGGQLRAGVMDLSHPVLSSTCSSNKISGLSPLIAQLREQNALLTKLICDGGQLSGGCCGGTGEMKLDVFLRSHQSILAGVVSEMQKLQVN